MVNRYFPQELGPGHPFVNNATNITVIAVVDPCLLLFIIYRCHIDSLEHSRLRCPILLHALNDAVHIDVLRTGPVKVLGHTGRRLLTCTQVLALIRQGML